LYEALKEMFEDVLYIAGKDRDGTPILCFLPRDARRIVSYNNLQEEQLIDFCMKMILEVASQGSYVLIIAGGGGTEELIDKRETFSLILTAWKR
jgi:hypothetical protein